MKNPLWIVLWIGTLAGAWYMGSEGILGTAPGSGSGTQGPASSSQVLELQEQVAELKAELQSRGPKLEGGDGAGKGSAGALEGGATGVMKAEGEAEFKPVYEFSLEGIETPEEVVAHFLAYGKTMLGMGREGHLKLLDQIFAWAADKEFGQKLERMFGSGPRAARHMVPLIQAGLDHREDIADMQETVLVHMLEKPEYFEGKDDDPLEVFTGGVGYLLPAVVSEERLKTWSGYVKEILKQPKESQPEAIQKNRRELERMLTAWLPKMTPDEILKMLEGGVTPDEALGLLQQLPADAIDKVDVGQYLAPKIIEGDWQAMRMLRNFRLTNASQANLDSKLIENAGKSNLHGWHFREYLRNTGRSQWAQARDFIERGLRSSDAATRNKFADAIFQLGAGGPDKAWAQWALGTFELSEQMKRRMKAQFKLD